MSTRQFCVVGVVAMLVWLADAETAAAQGTPSWAPNYPMVVNSVPPARTGGVIVFGSYTVAAGWLEVGANFSWTPLSGGAPQGLAIDFDRTTKLLGVKNAQNAIVPATISPLPIGQYQGWLTVTYIVIPQNPNVPAQPIISTVVPFTIN